MKHRKIIRLLVIPAALFITLLTVLVMCRRSAICGETYSDRADYAKTLGYSISADSETVQNIVIPAVFGSVYENYNALQKQCGFDLSLLLSATQNAKSGKRRDKPKLSGINQHKADCYAVCCVSQVVYPARCSKVSCQKNRCVFASIFYIC